MNQEAPAAIPFDAARDQVVAAVGESGARPPLVADRLLPADRSLVASLPAWVSSIGVLAEGDHYWILVTRDDEPEPGSEGGQFTMTVPGGRYFVDTLDLERREWIARESAPGGPLVGGLVCPGRAAIVRVRRLGD